MTPIDSSPLTPDFSENLLKYLDRLIGDGGESSRDWFPNLSFAEYLDPQQFEPALLLESHQEALQNQALSIPAPMWHRDTGTEMVKGRADVFYLHEQGIKRERNCQLMSAAANIAEIASDMRIILGSVYCWRIAPNSRTAPYVRSTNMQVQCCLPVVLPDGETGLAVGGHRRDWTAGHCIIYDNSGAPARLWNSTSEDLILLVIDLWHPDLTRPERRFLQGLQTHALKTALVLAAFWAANATAEAMNTDMSNFM